jgi:exodeoxyribonuclease V gamma subunit
MLFDDILSHWYEGMRRPLPLAVRTAFVWLNKADQGATLKAYEGTENSIGEVQTDAYQQRAYPDYAALCRSGEFYTLAEALLRPLQQAIHVNESSAANNPSGVAAA